VQGSNIWRYDTDSEEVEVFVFLSEGFWEIGDLHVLFEAVLDVFQLFLEGFSFLGVFEGNESSVERLSLLVVEDLLHLHVILCLPWGFFEGFHLSNDIIDLVIDLLEILVVNVHALFVVVDALVELLEDVGDFGLHFLALWGGEEFLVESLEVLHLLGVGPSLGGGFGVSDWLGFVDVVPDFLDISPFLGNFLLSSFADGNFKEVLELINMFIEIFFIIRKNNSFFIR